MAEASGCRGATELRLVLVQPGTAPVELTAALQGPGSGLALVNGFQLPGGEAVLLWAANRSLNSVVQAGLAKVRQDQKQKHVDSPFDTSPESGPRTAVITVDDDGHRNFWDLSIAS